MVLEYTPVEVIAGIVVLLVIVKLVVVLVSKRTWYYNVALPIYKNAMIAGFVYAVLASVVFYYLTLELTIVQIMAVMGFAGLMFGMAFLLYARDLIPTITKSIKEPLSAWRVIYILVWILLSVLAGKELLGY